mmetsp:Transcript_10291/g.20623  ORF Transcript_10291/g.20623 Transcript_10291/m.20623 type:complete len:101 (+) Transcript_10291:1493-1795(+)
MKRLFMLRGLAAARSDEVKQGGLQSRMMTWQNSNLSPPPPARRSRERRKNTGRSENSSQPELTMPIGTMFFSSAVVPPFFVVLWSVFSQRECYRRGKTRQ